MAVTPVPNFAIVNADGTPTIYFYRFMLDVRAGTIGVDDLYILETLADRSDVDAEASAIETETVEALSGNAADGSPADADPAEVAPASFDPAALETSATFDVAAAQFVAQDQQDLQLADFFADRSDPVPALPVIRDVLANIPSGFNASADGRLFYATDHKHIYRYDGATAAWHFLEGDGSGQVVVGSPTGGAPNGGLWGLCDGSAYLVAQDNGTTLSVTTQNLTGGVFITGDTAGAQQAATAPTFTGALTTGNDSGAGTTVQSGTGATVATHTHTHSLSATLNAPSVANGGLPLRIGVHFYIRR